MSTPKLEATQAVRPADVPSAQRAALRKYRSWQRFRSGPRDAGLPLLKDLPRYPDCVLVAGCQRSGTTMLTRIIAGAAGFARLELTHDDELDAALVLAGFVDLPQDRRYCFQTTYLNERYGDYRDIGVDQKLIWVVRNPYSVVHSMVYNWKRFALDELYEHCGSEPASIEERRRRARWPWPFGISKAECACSAYAGKSLQILAIRELMPASQLLVVDYDLLVRDPEAQLRLVFEFIGVPFDPAYAKAVRGDSLRKADRQQAHLRARIEAVAMPAYEKCRSLVRSPSRA